MAKKKDNTILIIGGVLLGLFIMKKQTGVNGIAGVKKTYDIYFDDEYNSNNLGFKESLKYCTNYVKTYNGTNHSYFANYKKGICRIICNETGETIKEYTIK